MLSAMYVDGVSVQTPCALWLESQSLRALRGSGFFEFLWGEDYSEGSLIKGPSALNCA